jgi:hypothetical protein
MRIVFLGLSLLIGFQAALFAQTAPARARFARQEIGNSGLKIAFPVTAQIDAPETDEAGNKTYSIVTEHEGVKYGAIIMHFAEPLAPLKTMQEADFKDFKQETVLMVLMDICTQLGFDETDGSKIGLGHFKEEYPDLVGVLDYWGKKNSKSRAIVKSWIDNQFIINLFILYEEGAEPNFNYQQLFLNGVFPPK